MRFLEITQGNSPLILGLPHTGTDVPPEIWGQLNETGRMLADTDWHVQDLYDGLVSDVTRVRTTLHRYVIDVNRDPSGVSLYPGQNTTRLVPTTDFEGRAIWRSGQAPGQKETEQRTVAYHAPYHSALNAEIARVKARNGFAILFDCHSIRSEIPFLFEGRLPDFNTGTNNGDTCASSIESDVDEICRRARGYTSVLNGRFKGGWTTRHHGRPAAAQHALQMELAQSTYMQEVPPWTYLPERAAALRTHLKTILDRLIRWRPE
ncbi:MAG: N-formylglutamate deformylase [Pseudomonadota bacterium]